MKKKESNCQTMKIKIWLWASKWLPTPRQTGRLSVGRKINLNLNRQLVTTREEAG
jgi:hypothetical protein